MAKRKERPQGLAVRSDEEATRLARKRAFWSCVPAAYQMEQGEAMDPQEQLDALSKEDKRDRDAFQQGDMQKCYIGTLLEEEEEQEREERSLRELGLWDEFNSASDAQYH